MVSSLTGTLDASLSYSLRNVGSLSCLRLCSSNIVDLLVMTGSNALVFFSRSGR